MIPTTPTSVAGGGNHHDAQERTQAPRPPPPTSQRARPAEEIEISRRVKTVFEKKQHVHSRIYSKTTEYLRGVKESGLALGAGAAAAAITPEPPPEA